MLTKPWFLGNTTLRNPRRLKEGLRVYHDSYLHGNLAGRENEQAFAILLHNEGVTYSAKYENDMNSDVSDMGRKWRSALKQLGFIKNENANEPYTITESGLRLINTESLVQENECFFRTLLAYQMPSVLEPTIKAETFNPIRLIIRILKQMECDGLKPYIDLDEMSSIVSLTDPTMIDECVEKIKQYRTGLSKAENKNKYKREYRERVAERTGSSSERGVKEGTLRDYADTSFRYFRLTGLFSQHSRKLSIADHKAVIANQLYQQKHKDALVDDNNYLTALWNGSSLPTDNTTEAKQEVNNLISILSKEGKDYRDLDTKTNDVKQLTQLRLGLEDDLFKVFETRYAEKQKDQWEDIIEYLEGLTNHRKSKLIPNGEAPAYFEWTVWRLFLALNKLMNKPWEARQFRIDDDFKPITTAPGGGPDIVFEFEEFVIVVEVTLTTSSRQEAAEGEPVRRHVADYVSKYEESGKKVFGLFIANTIDTNTAETFRIGSWYRKDDTKLGVNIVPVTISQLLTLVKAMYSGQIEKDYNVVIEVLKNCLLQSKNEAPVWKSYIAEEISEYITKKEINS